MKHASRSPRRALGPQARYSNYFEVGQNALEFMVDFGQYHPENTSAICHTRVVTGPVYAKLLMRLLIEAIGQHEAAHGPIPPVEDELDPLEHVRNSLVNFDTPRNTGGAR